AAVVLPGKAGEVSGVGPGDAGHREGPAPVGAAIGKGLQQGVLYSRAESPAFAELEVVVRAAVHERGEAVADAHVCRVLRGPGGEAQEYRHLISLDAIRLTYFFVMLLFQVSR